MPFRKALLFAIAITVAQVLFTLSFAPRDSEPGSGFFSRYRYTRLNNWDSEHYSDLVDHGYHMPPGDRAVTGSDVHQYRANLGYFPGYWVSARALKQLLGVSTYTALPLTAQLFGVAFWCYLALLFSAAGIRARDSSRYLLVIATYPSAFFLITGYSESAFMAMLVGYIYWCDRWLEAEDRHAPFREIALVFGIAALHGFGMAGTRIVGIPVAAYPVIRTFARKLADPARRGSLFAFDSRTLAGGALTLFSLLAPAWFFAHCEIYFAHWDWYFKLQTIGWGKDPNYLALFDPRSYLPHYFFEDTVDSISRTAVPLTAGLLVLFARRDWRHDRWSRVGLFYAAFSLFYIALSAKADTNMDSMIRYTWPAIALLLLARAGQWKERFDSGEREPPGYPFGGGRLRAALVLSLAIQGWSAYRFLHGKWVA